VNHIGAANHICHLYQGETARKDVALPFIRGGLQSGECCISVAEATAVESWSLDLQQSGIDVLRARLDGSLDIVTSIMWREQCFMGSIAMAREVLGVVREKLGEYPGIRIVADANWSKDPAMPADRVCHWEATENLVLDGLAAQVICQYDIDAYPPEYIIGALRTHPMVLYDGQKVGNPFYEAQRILIEEPMSNHNSNDAACLAKMLGLLKRGSQLETASRLLEQVLNV